MAQDGFQYDGEFDTLIAAGASAAGGRARLPLSLSIFADRELLRGAMEADARAAGFHIGRCGDISELLVGGDDGDDDTGTIGDVVLVDCPSVGGRGGGAALASLARLDLRTSRTGTQLIVSTSLEALDDVFGCLDQANPVVLVDPTRGQRVIALGDVLTKMPSMRMRELSEPDRMTLLRLTEQLGQIAERLEGLSRNAESTENGDSVFRFEAAKQEFHGRDVNRSGDARETDNSPKRASRLSLPDPRLVRQMIRQRQTRTKFFDAELFADPAWDMLLDLTAARAEHNRVSVTSLCIASGVPPTTALRWITQMVERGIMERVKDDADKRRAFIALSNKAADGMARYFAALAQDREMPV